MPSVGRVWSSSSIAVVMALVLLVSMPIQAQNLDEIQIKVQRLSEKAAVLSLGYMNTIVLASSDGLVVIDTNRTRKAGEVLRHRIGEVIGRDDILYVINTHYHWDHTGGNLAFSDAVIVGHEYCLEGMLGYKIGDLEPWAERYREIATEYESRLQSLDSEAEDAEGLRGDITLLRLMADDLETGFAAAFPSMTFTDKMAITLSDMTLQISYFGNAHTDSDLFIWVPEEGLLMTGDVYASGRIPFFREDIVLEIPRWLDNLNTLLEEPSEIKFIVSGHDGQVVTIADLIARRDYITALWTGIEESIVRGESLDQIQERFALQTTFPDLAELTYMYEGIDHHRLNVELVWKQLIGDRDTLHLPVVSLNKSCPSPQSYPTCPPE